MLAVSYKVNTKLWVVGGFSIRGAIKVLVPREIVALDVASGNSDISEDFFGGLDHGFGAGDIEKPLFVVRDPLYN